jgi:hypothetical protein
VHAIVRRSGSVLYVRLPPLLLQDLTASPRQRPNDSYDRRKHENDSGSYSQACIAGRRKFALLLTIAAAAEHTGYEFMKF